MNGLFTIFTCAPPCRHEHTHKRGAEATFESRLVQRTSLARLRGRILFYYQQRSKCKCAQGHTERPPTQLSLKQKRSHNKKKKKTDYTRWFTVMQTRADDNCEHVPCTPTEQMRAKSLKLSTVLHFFHSLRVARNYRALSETSESLFMNLTLNAIQKFEPQLVSL